MSSKVKNHGEIFTPDYLVNNMLDFVGYTGGDIEQKHVIDNSCGQGAFLAEIVKRYCKKISDKKQLKSDLEQFIHGIEIDRENAEECRKNLDKIAAQYGMKNVNWDIKNKDTLTVSEYDRRMDFVVGNPPYVRVHNLKENHSKVKSFQFSNGGMTDLFITFYEISFNMLNKSGKMCLITPSSWLSSVSGAALRDYIIQNRNLQKIIDVGHFQPFENVTTYTAIACFDNAIKTDTVDYYGYDGARRQPVFIDSLSYDDFYTDGKMFFGTEDDLRILSEINQQTQDVRQKVLEVKNGFATLADSIFIGDRNIQDDIMIDAVKASTGKWTKLIFPYNKKSQPLSERELSEKHAAIYSYLVSAKEKLLNRSIANPKEWYLFGRTQAIGDVPKDKLAINTTIKDRHSIKLNHVPAGQGVYSGLYIIYDGDYSEIEQLILSDNFVNYVKSLKKYKSGGYYTFSSKDLKNYLIYAMMKSNTREQIKEIHAQQSIFGQNQRLIPSLS